MASEEPTISEMMEIEEAPMEMGSTKMISDDISILSPIAELSPINSDIIAEPNDLDLGSDLINSNGTLKINIDEAALETLVFAEKTPSVTRGPSKLATRMISKESLSHVRRMIASKGKKSASYDLCKMLVESKGQGLPTTTVVKPPNRMTKFLEVRPTRTSRMRSKKPVEVDTIKTSDKKPEKPLEAQPRKVSRIQPSKAFEVKPTRTSRLRTRPSEVKIEKPSDVKTPRKMPAKEVTPTKTSKMRSAKLSEKPETPDRSFKIKPAETPKSSERDERQDLPSPQMSEADADKVDQEVAPSQEETTAQNMGKALPRIRVKPSERISSQTLCSLTRRSRLSANPSSSCRGLSIGLSLIASDFGDLTSLEKSVAKLGEEVLAMEKHSKDMEKAERVPKKKATKPIVVRQTKATLARVNRFKDPPAEPAENVVASPIAAKAEKPAKRACGAGKPRITLIDRLNMTLQAKKQKETVKELQTGRSNKSDRKPGTVKKPKHQARLGQKLSDSLLQTRSRTFPAISRSQVSDFRRGSTALARSIGTQAGLRASPSAASSIRSAPATPRGRNTSEPHDEPARQPSNRCMLDAVRGGTSTKTPKRMKRSGKKSTVQRKSKRKPEEMETLMMVKIYEAPKRLNRFGHPCALMTSADYVHMPRSHKDISLISDHVNLFPFPDSDSLSSISSVSNSEVGEIAIDMLKRQACQLRIYDDLDDDRIANPDEKLGHGHLFGPFGGIPGLPDNVRAMGQALQSERDAYHQKLMLVEQSISVMPVIEVTRLDTILYELDEERKLDEATAARVALTAEAMDVPEHTPSSSLRSVRPTAEDGCDSDDDRVELATPRPLMPVIPPSRPYCSSERSDSGSINIRITTKKPKNSEFYEFPTNVDDSMFGNRDSSDLSQSDDKFSDCLMDGDDRALHNVGDEGSLNGKDLFVKGDSDSDFSKNGDKYHDFIMDGEEGSKLPNKDDSDGDLDLGKTSTQVFSMHSIP